MPSVARRIWFRRVAGRLDLDGAKLWTVTADDLKEAGMGAPLHNLGREGVRARVRDVLVDPRTRWSTTPVTSQEWLDLLASGGGEELGGTSS